MDNIIWGIIPQRVYQLHVHVVDQLEPDEFLLYSPCNLCQFLKFCFHKV